MCNQKDIVNALSESHFPSSRWSPLGLQLSLLQPTLIDIKAKYNNDQDEWLSRADNVVTPSHRPNHIFASKPTGT